MLAAPQFSIFFSDWCRLLFLFSFRCDLRNTKEYKNRNCSSFFRFNFNWAIFISCAWNFYIDSVIFTNYRILLNSDDKTVIISLIQIVYWLSRAFYLYLFEKQLHIYQHYHRLFDSSTLISLVCVIFRKLVLNYHFYRTDTNLINWTHFHHFFRGIFRQLMQFWINFNYI